MGLTFSNYLIRNLITFVKSYYKVRIKQSKEHNKLFHKLHEKIKSTGPITVAAYMKECLLHPQDGYYINNDIIGESGDYTTSPEISQIFGEMIAIWFLFEWSKCGSPKPLQIVELGPGKGTLCHDMLRVFQQFMQLRNVIVNLVEVSPKLSAVQAKKLCDRSAFIVKETYYRHGMAKQGNQIRWYMDLDDVPKGVFTLFVANEFFDALPIHKFEQTDSGYREVLVDIDSENSKKFRFVQSEGNSPMQRILSASKDIRKHIEKSPESMLIIQKMARRIETDGGLALLADYGHMGDKGDTFRAFRKHTLHDPLLEPGTADLTADVNFLDLKNAALNGHDVLVFGPVPQRDFLQRQECEMRYKQLVEYSKALVNSDDWKEQLENGYKMLVDEDKMGERFKFFAIVPKKFEALLRKYPVCGFDS